MVLFGLYANILDTFESLLCIYLIIFTYTFEYKIIERILKNYFKFIFYIDLHALGALSTYYLTKPAVHNEMASKYAYRKHNSYLLQVIRFTFSEQT